MRRLRTIALTFFGWACFFHQATALLAQEKAAHPTGAETTAGADRETLTGKVMAGYQGWFAAEGDGFDQGWKHYANRGAFRPGRCSIDLWPDLSEFDEDERFATPFRFANGDVAPVFSSNQRKTVLRHFRWMREYGLDGVFVQRFVVETMHPGSRRHFDTVLAHCREGANREGRCYAVMYDLSGLGEGGTEHLIADWKRLIDETRLGRDEADHAYLRHEGKPLVAVWGVGFNDGRRYTLDECDRLVDFLKNDPVYGGNAVMLGVPSWWRTLERDAVNDPALLKVIAKADVVSPWSVGRYDSPEGVARHAALWREDVAWCQEREIEFLPVAFPGFSWHNMRPQSPLNQIPRRGGEFLWRQLVEAQRAGAKMAYVAMFDELDEGTAIFKCTNDPPVGESTFVAEKDLPSDHYLWLTGEAARKFHDGTPLPEQLPIRKQ